MKQLTVDYIKAAYEETGLRPVRNEFGSETNDGDLCGCILTVLAYKKHKDHTDFSSIVNELEDDGFSLADVTTDFGKGLIFGFDEDRVEGIESHWKQHKSEEWVNGYRFGLEVRNELFEYRVENDEWVLKEVAQ